jgi:hypothetical protein
LLLCLSSFEAALKNDCLSWEVPAFLAILSGFSWGLYWLWKHSWYQDDNFRLVFINNPPAPQFPQPCIDELVCFKILQLNPTGQDLFLKVRSRFGFKGKVKKLDLRFLNLDGSDIAQINVVAINNVWDYFNPGNYTMKPNGCWGIEVEYNQSIILARNSCLYLKIRMLSYQPWTGHLSFSAQDEAGFYSYARYAVAFGMIYEEAIKSW